MSNSKSQRLLLPLFIGSLLVILTLIFWWQTDQIVKNYDRARFNTLEAQIEQTISARMDTYINALLQTRSMFHVTREVDAKEFRAYIDGLSLLEKYPGVQGIGYTERVPRGRLREHERKYRKLWPSRNIEEAFSIIYLEPLDWRNARALGFDMTSNETRREAMELARDSNAPVMSDPVELVQETETDKQPGFLLYIPLYRTIDPTTIHERRDQLKGFVYSPFRTKDLFEQMLKPFVNEAVNVSVNQITPKGSQLIYTSGKDDKLAKISNLRKRVRLNFGRKEWIVEISALESFLQPSTFLLPLVVLLIGFCASLYVTYIINSNIKQALLLEEKSFNLGKLLQASNELSTKIQLDDLVQTLTDIGRELSNAEFGAFFYKKVNEKGESYSLFTVSGVPRSEFEKFPMPRKTAVFGPTFEGEATVISDDITKDPRYGKNSPYYGMPEGHLPVRSYLAVSVVSRSGIVLGGLFYGHHLPAQFGEREKILVEGLAAQAAIAIDNARYYEEARHAIMKRDEFLSIASHELKTPITSMKLQFQMAQRGIAANNGKVFDRPAVEKRVLTAVRQLDRMSRLIDEMLDTSRIVLGKFQIQKKPFNLSKLVSDSLERFHEQFLVENVAVAIDIEEDLIVDGDEFRLEQVLNNLVNNALKYGEQRPVTITLKGEGDQVKLTVKDNGIGIPKESLAGIFNRFERVNSTTNVSGLGLGLYISNVIVEAHGGKIKVTSEPGQGSTFEVQLPVGEIAPKLSPT